MPRIPGKALVVIHKPNLQGQSPRNLPSPAQRAGLRTGVNYPRPNGPSICDGSRRGQTAGPLALYLRRFSVPRPLAWARQTTGPLARKTLLATCV